MRIGIRGHDFGRLSPEALTRRMADHQVEAAQLAIPKAIEGVTHYRQVDAPLLARIKAAFEENGATIPVLGCYIEPSLPDEAERQNQLEVFREGIRCAAFLKAGCIGTETSRFEGGGSEREKRFDLLCKSVEWMLEEAGKTGVTVAVEPVAVHTLCNPALTARLLERFRGSGLRIIFDPINLLTAERIADQNALWKECFDAFGREIIAVHVKDAKLQDGAFFPALLGEGVMDYTSVIVPWMRANHPEIALLREEIQPETADQDLSFMRKTFLA